MPDWLAHLLVPIWVTESDKKWELQHPPPTIPILLQGLAEEPPSCDAGHWGLAAAHLQPDHALPSLHLGLIKVPLLPLRVFHTDVHTALQPFGFGLRKGSEE